jgi:hypothetical protein
VACVSDAPRRGPRGNRRLREIPGHGTCLTSADSSSLSVP